MFMFNQSKECLDFFPKSEKLFHEYLGWQPDAALTGIKWQQ